MNMSPVFKSFHQYFSLRNLMLRRRIVMQRHFCSHKQTFIIPIYPKMVWHISLPVPRVQALKYLTTDAQYNEGFSSLTEYETVSEETLQSITERFEEIVEVQEEFIDSDVNYSDGVLTVYLGKFGTYVINKQTPNRQIWFSSPVSGPKRFDFKQGRWIYKHEQVFLHDILSEEISSFISKEVDFSDCSYGR